MVRVELEILLPYLVFGQAMRFVLRTARSKKRLRSTTLALFRTMSQQWGGGSTPLFGTTLDIALFECEGALYLYLIHRVFTNVNCGLLETM